MIFYCDLQGNLKAFQNETVYQGSNNVTTIYVVAPFSRPVGLNISFTKPNKLVTSPAVMKWVGTLGNVKIPVSFVNIPEQFTDTYNVWAYALPYSITEQNGVVGVSVNAVIADSVDASGQQAYKGNLTTFTGQFTVAYSALPEPPTDIPTEWTQDKVLDLLNNYYNDAIQKIGEMNTLKTDAKDTLVKAINEVFDEIASTNATIGDLSNLTTDEKTTIVGAINEVDAHANTAQQTADNATELANTGISKAEQAQATANSAVNTANEAKTKAQTAETNANNALDTANAANATAGEAKAIAQGSQRAIGFATLKAAITALNGYDNSQLKVGDNVYIVETGVPDLWVAAVEQNSVAYNYTTNDAFNDDLVENTLVQVGYNKFAYLESDGKPCTVAWQNMTVAASDWVASTEFADFAYEAKIALTDFVNFSSIPQVVFGLTEATSGNYAPICKAGDKGVYIYSKVNTAITLPTVVTFAPNVHGASMQGGGYNNRGKWVASTTYEIDDLVYTDNGQYVCIEGITSTTSPEQDTTHWQATFVATGKTKNGLKFSGQNGNGTEVQKTFDGSQAVEIAFDENTMTAKEVNGVLEIGAKGTVPEALPQEASAVKSGNLPTSGWVNIGYKTLYDGYVKILSGTSIYNNGTLLSPSNYSDNTTLSAWAGTMFYWYSTGYEVQKVEKTTQNGVQGVKLSFSNSTYFIYIMDNGELLSQRTSAQLLDKDCKLIIKATFEKSLTYTISDTSITANSDILMELTDDGGVKAYSMEAGKITVIRDTVPTQPIPYTYKVKQTNASGQFTVLNHYVAGTPTALPQLTDEPVTQSFPTHTNLNGWEPQGEIIAWRPQGEASGTVMNIAYAGDKNTLTSVILKRSLIANNNNLVLPRTSVADGNYTYSATENGNTFTVVIAAETITYTVTTTTAAQTTLYGLQRNNTAWYGKDVSLSKIGETADVMFEYTDSGDTKLLATKYSGDGSLFLTFGRVELPTSDISYTYKVKKTNSTGQITVINHYCGNVKTSEANTFTAVQTFSNIDGISVNRVHNLNGNAWYDFDGTNDRLGSLATPTIIRTSEARPKAEVPSGTGTVTKEIALLEDVPGALGEWVTVPGETATLTEAGTYQVVLYGSDRNVQSIIYWDGSTAAQGIYSTVVDLLESRPVMVSRFPQITAEGVISFGWVTISQSVQGDWLESNTTVSGFKYRKIN